MAEQSNYYQVLGVSREATQDEIRAAYRRLAKERHPDHPSGSAEDFSLLQEAHAVLSDPNRRRKHDEQLDLAHAADQLSGLDFGTLEDELAARRQERESGGTPLGERLRGRFARKEKPPRGGRDREDERRRGRYEVREGRWYEPHNFDPEPVTWRTGAISFVAAFVAFIAAGQLGLWALGVGAGPLAFTSVLAPFLPILYTLVGLVTAYFAYKTAGYAGLGLVFLAVLVVGGQGPPERLLQFGTLGIIILLVVMWLGNRRDSAAR